MAYDGPERRIHRVFVTRNTEYHVRSNVCVAVRDRRSGDWYRTHEAINRQVSGAVSIEPRGVVAAAPRTPNVGDALCFENSFLVTSPVESIERPERAVVALYPTAA